MEQKKIYACFWVIMIISAVVNARPQSQDIDMDMVVRDIEGRQENPGWIRRQLFRAGEAASRIGSGVGGYAVRLTNAVDRICGVIKKIIPIVGAVCTVGQFKFCALDNATGDMGGVEGVAYEGRREIGPQTDLDALDK